MIAVTVNAVAAFNYEVKVMSDIIVNKVIKGDETYLDLTNDTVSEGTLLKNRTAHNSEGIQIQGVMEEGGGSVTGVKGDAEPAYRDGNVNITAANIGTYTASQIDTLLNEKVDAHGTDSLMTNAEHVKLAGIEAGAEENVIESISLNGEEITPVNKAVALSVIDKDVDDLTNYYKKSETDASLGAKQNIILSSTLSIGGQTVTEVEEALGSLADISKSMTGATSSSAGKGGFVPSPSAGDENKALFGDGTWKSVSGGGGHTILDEDGVTYPQRSKLQFEGCEVTDDSTNDITKIKAEGGVTGVKGNAETDYRTGNVNLTPAHVGAVDEVEYEEDIYGVNLLNVTAATQTIRGMTFTVNADKSVTINGTPSGGEAVLFYFIDIPGNVLKEKLGGDNKQIIASSFCPPGGTPTTYFAKLTRTSPSYHIVFEDDGNGSSFNTNDIDDNGLYRCFTRFPAGTTINNVTIYPMLYDARFSNILYRGFNDKSIQNQITTYINTAGVRNYFNFYTPTVTSQGITFVNSGGIITANGTSGSSAFPFIECRKTIPAGTYIATGCPSGGGSVAESDNYSIIWRKNNGNGTIIGQDYGEGATFTLTEETVVNCRCLVSKNSTYSNLTFKPMIRLASDPDLSFAPGAPTNRELTSVVDSVTPSEVVRTIYNNKLVRQGVMVFMRYNIVVNQNIAANTSLGTIPESFRTGTNVDIFAVPELTGGTVVPVSIRNNGNVECRVALTSGNNIVICASWSII